MKDIISNPQKRIRWPAPGQLITGILLVILGAIFLFAHFLGQWFISYFWPFFLVVGGLIFFAVYFARHEKPPGYDALLMPGTYLIVLGLLFMLMNLVGWYNMRFMWPTFVLGIPIALAVMYKLGPREKGDQRKDLLGAITILTVISVVLFVLACGGLYLWPVVLIIIGLAMLIKNMKK